MAFPEALLHGMKLAVHGQALDRRNRRAVGLHGEKRARLDGLAVEEHRAGATNACFAADVCPRQPAQVAQEMNKQQPRLDVEAAIDAVDVN